MTLKSVLFIGLCSSSRRLWLHNSFWFDIWCKRQEYVITFRMSHINMQNLSSGSILLIVRKHDWEMVKQQITLNKKTDRDEKEKVNARCKNHDRTIQQIFIHLLHWLWWTVPQLSQNWVLSKRNDIAFCLNQREMLMCALFANWENANLVITNVSYSEILIKMSFQTC